MNQHSSIKGRGSLIERATEIYDFSAALKGRAAPAVDVPADTPPPVVPDAAPLDPVAAPALRAPVLEAPPEVPAMDEGASPAAIDDVQLGESSP